MPKGEAALWPCGCGDTGGSFRRYLPSCPVHQTGQCRAALDYHRPRGVAKGRRRKPDTAYLSVVADEGRQHVSGFAPPHWCTLILFPLCDLSRGFFTAAPLAGQIRNVRRSLSSGNMFEV